MDQTNKSVVKNNSEILFIYDAKQCNPNGDIDNENKPRIDYQNMINLVSDVRLKRYIRNYFMNKGIDIFIRKENGQIVDATTRYNNIGNKEVTDFIDVRLFGLTLPIKAAKGSNRGTSESYIGPVQFTWGYSLNKVELIDSSAITSHFAGATTGEEQEGGAIGRDWRLYYSLIAFYGRISSKAAYYTKLSPQDIDKFDKAVWESIITETNTRTKLNQTPRLYIRIEYSEDCKTYTGDLRRYIDIDKKEGLRDICDFSLEVKEKLYEIIKGNVDKINKIYYRYHPELKIKYSSLEKLKEIFKGKEDKIINLESLKGQL